MTEVHAHPAVEPAEPHWMGRAAFPLLSLAMVGAEASLGLAVYHGLYGLAVPLVLIVSHIMHGQLIGFHEASHGLLRKSRRLNEIDGVLLGTFSFMSFSLYRAAHQTHHVHLGTARDEEFWPFVDVNTPRRARILAALFELTCGLIATPLLFARTFLRANSPIRAPRVRRRVWLEWALMLVVWGAIYALVAWFGWWKYFLWMYLVPGVLAGNFQSWRKYIEHVGLTGSTTNSLTRNVVARGWAGRFFAVTLLHEPYHGVHHQHAGVTHAELPGLAASIEPRVPGERAPFPSYRHALFDLLRTLRDPRVGAQWNVAADAAAGARS